MKQIYRSILLLAVSLGTISSLQAQYRESFSSGEILEGLRKLKVLGAVLYVAAHPDDENTRLITYLSREKLYRTGYLSLTRGDGGQNLIGDEQGVELGLIRTQELLAARRLDGGEQFFSRAFDFGYSKSPEETLEKWNREKILHDVVWVIRKFRPDIVITRFPTTGEGGHGHHTSSAILANEAYAAAADPKRFPEQLKYVEPWQVKRVLWNTFSFGNVNTIRDDQFKVDVGGYNPSLGRSNGEIAAESRSQHKSQGFGVPSSRGESYEWFATTQGKAPVKDLMDDVNTSWQRVAGAENIPAQIDALLKAFDPLHPEKLVPGLVTLYHHVNALDLGYWKDQKLKEIRELLLQCSGFYAEAFARVPAAVPGDSLQLQFSLISRLSPQWQLEKVSVDGYDTSFYRGLAVNKSFDWSKRIVVPANHPFTQPYWLAEPMEEGSFVVNDLKKIGQPDVDPAWTVTYRVRINDLSLEIKRPLLYKYTDPVKGEQYQPLVVLPAMELQYSQENYLLRMDSATQVRVQFQSNRKDSVDYQIQFLHSKKWSSSLDAFRFSGYTRNEASAFFRRAGSQDSGSVKERIALRATDRTGRVFGHYRKEIQYDHIPHIIYFPRAEANLISLKLHTGKKKVGYIAGAGDKVPQALELMGYELVMLGNRDLAQTDLSQFDAIITGIRAYNTNDWMNNHYDRLMQYVREGGRMIVQYNTSSQIGPVRARIAPYEFDIARNRITNEKAAVELLAPNDVLFNKPNRINASDFEGWIQERSIYHAGSWQKPYFEPMLRMQDPNESPHDGALIRARYGKGMFIYTGLVFFRQLPAGVPGAYRLMANLIEAKEDAPIQ